VVLGENVRDHASIRLQTDIHLRSDKYRYPIFTIPVLLSGRQYIVASPALISLVQRNAKTLSFEVIVSELTSRMAPSDPGADIIIKRGLETRDPAHSLLLAMHDLQIENLGPGKVLDNMSGTQLQEMARMVDEIDSGVTTGLFQWLRHLVTISNMLAVYGPNNIMALDPSLEEDFWLYEAGMSTLLIGVAPWLLAPKAYRAQRKLVDALARWAENGYWNDASDWIKNRRSLNMKYGLSNRQAAQVEVGMMFGILANAMPTTFWLLTHIWSRPELLKEVREELESADGLVKAEGSRRIINIQALKTQAPLLNSVFREVLRITAPVVSVRVVLEDTIIADQYLLKKGSVVQIPALIANLDPNNWGSDAHEFNPNRFQKTVSGTITNSRQDTGKEKTVHPAAFRSFGGGGSLCPGRHFAQMEIVGLSAMLILGFELKPPGGGKIVVPEQTNLMLPLSIYRPKRDVKVEIRRREGMENMKWSFSK